jgi:hypothetical protein
MNSFLIIQTVPPITVSFDESKIGSNASSNLIKTKGLCYEIEVYPSSV